LKLLDECDDLSSRNSRLKAEKESFSTRLRDAEEISETERRLRQKADRTIARLEKKISSIVSTADSGGASAAEKDMWKSRYDKTREECEAAVRYFGLKLGSRVLPHSPHQTNRI
jgi:hypothetical protein